MRDRILVFAKAPVPGQVKTRLIPRLGAERAAALHLAFVEDVVASASTFAPVVLYHDPGAPVTRFAALGVPLRPQQGRELGERMAHAIRDQVADGAERIVVLGADSPDLPPIRLSAALTALDAARVVIGPALDGGYYLIGSRGTPPPALFAGIPWGGAGVLAATLRALRESGVGVRVLEPWYDIDRPEDLDFLVTHLELLDLASAGGRCPATCRELGIGA